MNVIQAVLILTGALMIFSPRVLTKQADRDNQDVVKRVKNQGYWVFFAGVIWVVADMLIK